jgi:predicted PurR-regulated permease PerM
VTPAGPGAVQGRQSGPASMDLALGANPLGVHHRVSDTASPERRPVPVRTIATAIAMVLGTWLLLLLLREVSRVLTWMIVAAFIAVALTPVVSWTEHRVTRGRRALATLLVFLLLALVVGGLVTLFALPLARQGTMFTDQLPQLLDDTASGRGPLGDLLQRTHTLDYVQDNEDRIKEFVTGLTTPTGVLRGVLTGVAATVSIVVLAYLMVLEGPLMADGFLGLLKPETRPRVRAVAADCAKSITGYLSGNLLISVICGVATYVVLLVMGVPFAGLIALFVAVTDLIPLVGATIGATVGVLAAALHSVPALVVVAIFFVVYQQVENHVLQPVILARTVKLNPLAVLVSILLAVELAGVLGALLAIPVASVLQVIARDLWQHRAGRPKAEPTVGEDRVPAEAADAEQRS